MRDEIDLLVADVTVGGEESVLVILAGDQGKAHFGRRRIGRWKGSRSADSAVFPSGYKLVVVPGIASQPLDADQYGVAIRRMSYRASHSNNVEHAGIGGNLPCDLNGTPMHSAAIQRVGCEAGPQHNRITSRIA